ncbi:hypothetical protein [Methylobacterium sp. WL7]|uniref:hypothetical protein n=1 Tax=Methylobacterium sp. WL7 TaxID=2603900 RepID=UPI0011CC00E6|nr:hypothetical protein [Methylobacterium sp. WL7]TXN38510.1 hypothetical protein FV233_29095 [Methylobacterium sp. WL7]
MAGTSAPAERVSAPEANTTDLRAHAAGITDEDWGFDDDLDEGGSAAERQARETPKHETATEAAEETEEAREPLPSEGITDEDMGEEGEPEVEEPEDGEDATKDAKGEDKPEEAKDAITVKIDGQEYPIEEIKRGFMRTADYTRKTQEVAETRKQVETYQQRLQQSEGELAQVLDLATEITRGSLPQPPSQSMIDTDPQGYLRAQAHYTAEVQKLEKLVQARQSLGQQQTHQQRQAQEAAKAEQTQAAQVALQNEIRLMQEKLPELRTPEGRNTFFADAQKQATAYGLAPEDIAGIQDHRLLLVLKDAMAFRKLQSAKPAAVEKAKAAPPIRPATRPPGTRDEGGRRAALERFHRDPSIQNAAATIPDSWLE